MRVSPPTPPRRGGALAVAHFETDLILKLHFRLFVVESSSPESKLGAEVPRISGSTPCDHRRTSSSFTLHPLKEVFSPPTSLPFRGEGLRERLMDSDIRFLFPTLRNTGCEPLQLFGIKEINRRDDSNSPAGLVPMGRLRSITPLETVADLLIRRIGSPLRTCKGR